MRILVVEDERRISADICSALQSAGFATTVSFDGDDAWFRGDTEAHDLVILDLGLPKMDGLAVLKRWRQAGLKVPVLVLTARGAWAERVEGIESGADDYLTKPFRMEELVARVKALLRRAAGHGSPVIEAGDFALDTRQMRILRSGAAVALSPLEYRLAAYLMLHKGRVVSAGELIEHIYGDDDARDANALEALIVRLRRKLGTEAVHTRRGFGYLIPDEAKAK